MDVTLVNMTSGKRVTFKELYELTNMLDTLEIKHTILMREDGISLLFQSNYNDFRVEEVTGKD